MDAIEYNEVTWFFEDDTQHSTFRENEIKYKDLILCWVLQMLLRFFHTSKT